MATLLLSEHEELEEQELPRGEGGEHDDQDDDSEDDEPEEAWRQPLTEVRDQLAELRATTEAKFSESQAKLDQVQETAAAVLAKVNEPPPEPPSTPQESPGETTKPPQEPAPNDEPTHSEVKSEETESGKSGATAEPPKTKLAKVLRRRRSI